MRLTTLRARDPSIIAWKAINYSDGNDSPSEDILEENHLRVYLRIKDGIERIEDLYQVSESQIIVTKSSEATPMRYNTKDETMKKYNFTKIFGPKTNQCEIFDELVKPKLLKFINGQNSTLLTYGVSSSGKTYTIVGTADEPGIIPRSLQYVFKTLPKLTEVPNFKPTPFGKMMRLSSDQVIEERSLKEKILNFHWSSDTRNEHINTYCTMQARLSHLPVAELEEDFAHLGVNVWVSFAEIYNEHIYDLLQTGNSKKEKLKLGCVHGETYIKNLSLINVTSGLEAYQILQYGLHHLNYAKTNINDHSSRSHSIFTIWLAQAVNNKEEEYHLSRFNFCDLAGAERSKKTLNVGERMKESQNINTSLLVLGRCIAAVRKAQKYPDNTIIPFRDSKLTQLFQKALSGMENISMIVNISLCRELFDETQHVLNFSAIAKDIVVIARPVLQPKSERFSELLERSANPVYLENDEEKSKLIEKYANELSEIENKITLEEMDQMREVESMRANIIAGYTMKYEDQNEKMQYEMLAMEKKLEQEKKKKLELLKKEIMEDIDGSIVISDEDSDTSRSSATIETIYVSSSSEDEYSDIEEAIVISSSDDEVEVKKEEDENDIDLWKRKVEEQDILIAEHHKTIAHLVEQLRKFGDIADLKNMFDNQTSKIQDLMKRRRYMWEQYLSNIVNEKDNKEIPSIGRPKNRFTTDDFIQKRSATTEVELKFENAHFSITDLCVG